MGYENDLQNLGLLSGGAQGFIKGIQDAEDHSMRLEDQKMRKMELDAKLRSQDQEREQQRAIREREESIKAMSMGMRAPEGRSFSESRPEEWQQDPAWEARQLRLNEARAGADPFGVKAMGAKKEMLQLQEAQRKASQEQKGFKLPPDKVLSVQEGQQLPVALSDIEGTIAQNKDLFGPVSGRMSSMNPYDTRAQTIDSQMRTYSQKVGRYLEGGVLRKEDEDKYRKMLPQLTDTPEVANNKLAVVKQMLAAKHNADVEALSKQGYDVSGFSAVAPGELPKGLGKAKGKLKSGLVAEPKKGLLAAPATQKPLEEMSDAELDALHKQVTGGRK